jgi:phosphoribosylpyrophosphate synthetase
MIEECKKRRSMLNLKRRSIVMSDVVPPFRLNGDASRDAMDTIHVALLLARAIRRLHHGKAVTALAMF